MSASCVAPSGVIPYLDHVSHVTNASFTLLEILEHNFGHVEMEQAGTWLIFYFRYQDAPKLAYMALSMYYYRYGNGWYISKKRYTTDLHTRRPFLEIQIDRRELC